MCRQLRWMNEWMHDWIYEWMSGQDEKWMNLELKQAEKIIKGTNHTKNKVNSFAATGCKKFPLRWSCGIELSWIADESKRTSFIRHNSSLWNEIDMKIEFYNSSRFEYISYKRKNTRLKIHTSFLASEISCSH